MKIIYTVTILFLFTQKVFAQNLTIGLSYNHLMAKQLDKAIETYNISRPFLKLKQNKLINGINGEIGYFFMSNKMIKQGIHFNYSFYNSKIRNENLLNVLSLHITNLNYVICFKLEKLKRLTPEIQLGATSSLLTRKINNEYLVIDDKKYISNGYGFNSGFKLTYVVFNRSSYSLAPYFFLGYTPFLFAPKNEAVINGTQHLITKNWTSLFNFKIGICYQLNRGTNRN